METGKEGKKGKYGEEEPTPRKIWEVSVTWISGQSLNPDELFKGKYSVYNLSEVAKSISEMTYSQVNPTKVGGFFIEAPIHYLTVV